MFEKSNFDRICNDGLRKGDKNVLRDTSQSITTVTTHYLKMNYRNQTLGLKFEVSQIKLRFFRYTLTTCQLFAQTLQVYLLAFKFSQYFNCWALWLVQQLFFSRHGDTFYPFARLGCSDDSLQCFKKKSSHSTPTIGITLDHAHSNVRMSGSGSNNYNSMQCTIKEGHTSRLFLR